MSQSYYHYSDRNTVLVYMALDFIKFKLNCGFYIFYCLLHLYHASICRCSGSNYLLHTSVSVCTSTLWHTSCWVFLRTSCGDVASMQQCPWLIQYFPLESACLSSSFPILYVQILEEDKDKWMDVFGWNIVVHYR